jgi:hypothetical protein
MADDDDVPADETPSEPPAEDPERVQAIQRRLREETKRYQTMKAKRQMR